MIKIKKEYLYIPIFLIISIMPLIIYGKIDYLDYITYINWDGSKAEIDFFSYYKAMFTIIMTIIASILYIKNKHNLKRVDYIKEYKYLLFILIVAIISFLFSEYKSISLGGFLFRYEGILVIISYISLIYISVNIFDNEKSIKNLIYCILFSYFIIALIGIMQYFGFDLFNNLTFQKMIIPNKHEYLVGKLNVFARKNEIVSSTIGNSNYVGYYYALTMPIFFILSIMSKDIKKKVLYMLAVLIGIAMLLITSSETGLISSFMAMTIFLICYWRKLGYKGKRNLLVGLSAVLIICFGNYFSKGFIYEKIDDFKYKFIYESTVSSEKNILQDIKINNNNVSLKYKDKLLKMSYGNNKISFFDNKGKRLFLSQNIGERKGTFYINNEEYNDLSVMFTEVGQDKTKAIVLEISKNIEIDLTIENGVFKYINHAGKIIDPNEKVKVLFGNGKEELLTSRIYIWARTIPKIFEKPLFGYGPDTFEVVFPNNDYIGLYRAYDTTNMIVDKPHNTYIQIAINIGIIALILSIILMLIYFNKYIKFVLKDSNNIDLDKYYYAITTAIISFFIAAIMYDSTIAITPIFCILLGVGIRLSTDYEKNKMEG